MNLVLTEKSFNSKTKMQGFDKIVTRGGGGGEICDVFGLESEKE